jgi:hypothetical protein
METAIEFWERPLNAASIDERSVAFQDWLQHRKDFGAALLQAGLARMRRLTAADIERLALALREGAETKHLLVWALNDETLQSDLRRMRWDGGLEQVEGDYVMIVDANLGWNKADRYIERRFDYHVVLGEERPKAQLSLIYDNRSSVETSECVHAARYEDSYEALANQCYWNYVRVLVPRESALVRSEGNQGEVSVTLLGGYTAFGVFMVVPPGETRSVRLEYWLPSGIGATARRGHRYALWVQKQPGTLATRGIVHVTLASERDVVFTAPGWRQSGPREVSREEMISRDTQMALIWREAAR